MTLKSVLLIEKSAEQTRGERNRKLNQYLSDAKTPKCFISLHKSGTLKTLTWTLSITKTQTADRTPTSRWGCWQRWRGWWVLGRRHTAAHGGRRPPISSLSAARAASSLRTWSTAGHWEALRGRGRCAAGHPGTYRSHRDTWLFNDHRFLHCRRHCNEHEDCFGSINSTASS